MLLVEYNQKIKALMDVILTEELGTIRQAAEMIAESIQNDGLFHVFGCGHSHLLVEEMFCRAGGLVPVNAIFESSIMLHEGGLKSTQIEQMSGYAKHILDNYRLEKGEVLLIVSTSGINSLPVEMAMEARERGLKVIALTSSYYANQPSRHSSGKRLYELADVVIDNKLPYGDALLNIPGSHKKMAPGSTVIGAYILNLLSASIVQHLVDRHVNPPVFVSGNIPGGMEQNQKYIEKYRHRIKHM